MKTANYHVPAISCNHCVMTIKRELSDLEGVTSVQASVETKDISVKFDALASERAIEELLEEIGYPAQR